MAEKVAINVFADLSNNKNISDFQVKEILTVKIEEKTAFYIVNFKPTGFIIISASDAAIPILGSSTQSNFSLENLPPQLSYLLEFYKTQIKEIENQKIAPTEVIKQKWYKYSEDVVSENSPNSLKSATYLASTVSPMLSTIWNQNEGWNRYCPANSAGPGGFCYAGCSGVALAQVLYFWGCRVNESGTIIDTHFNNLAVNLTEADYPWSSMSTSSSDYNNSKLIYNCALATQTNFGATSSGGSTDAGMSTLVSNFGFKNSVTDESSSSYSSNDWLNKLKNELNQGRPIIYEGTDFTVTPSAKHAWIIDGYDSNDKFHCNWGWGGHLDDYFFINNLNPSNSFNTYNWAMTNIEPVMQNCDIINGSSLICTSGTSFNLPNLPAGAAVTWNKSSNITFDNQPGNPKTFIANGSGSGWIEATVHNNGVATLESKSVWVGSPSIPTVINGFGVNGMEFGQNSIYEFSVAPPDIQGVTSNQWVVGGGTILSGQGTNMITVRTAANPNGITKYFDVSIRVGNSCGWSAYLWRTGFVGTGIGSTLIITPNPSTGETTLSLITETNEPAKLTTDWNYEIYDSMQSLKEKKTILKISETKINTSSWKEGVYIVRALVGDKTLTAKMVVRH